MRFVLAALGLAAATSVAHAQDVATGPCATPDSIAFRGNQRIKAADKWNTYEIIAKGAKFTVTLNGQRTVDGAENDKLKSGRIGLQYGAGFVKFRLVQIKPL